jgi:hypothetical protein
MGGGDKMVGRNKVMLRPHDVPECIVEAMHPYNLTDEDYYLYGCGRALSFIRMAADALNNLGNEQKIAEYHGYTGISAARTSIDAAANWMNIKLGIGWKPSLKIDFTKNEFYKEVGNRKPSINSHIDCLRSFAKEIDKNRQRAQHGEGLAMLYYSTGQWYLTNGLQAHRNEDKHLVNLLREWADKIEEQICQIIQVLSP